MLWVEDHAYLYKEIDVELLGCTGEIDLGTQGDTTCDAIQGAILLQLQPVVSKPPTRPRLHRGELYSRTNIGKLGPYSLEYILEILWQERYRLSGVVQT